MATDPFDDLSPEVAALFAAARETEPVSPNPALFAAMTDAVASGRLIPQTPPTRRRFVIGKVVTAKVAAVTGALLLSGGVAAAATGTLPDTMQDAASDAAEVVGVEIPEGNHGAKVSTVARDKSNDGEENHGKTVSSVARDNHGHNKSTTTTVASDDDDTSNSGPGNSRGAGKSEDSNASDNSKGRGGNDSDDDDDDSTTSTTVNDDVDDSDDDAENDSDDDASSSQNRGKGGAKAGKPASTDD